MTGGPAGRLPDGREVHRIALQCGPLRADVLTLGAIVQGLWLDGVSHSLVLGCPDIGDYLGPARYFGAIVGRCANRIGGARFAIDGQVYRTDPNFRGRHTLHGGQDGADAQIWRVEARSGDSVLLSLDLPDGHMGFPGRIGIAARIVLSEDALSFILMAESDAPTPCNLTHHGLFDLDGTGDIRAHRLTIAADCYLPVDDDLIPTGAILPVAGTRFDFRQPRLIGASGYDHNFCLSDGRAALRPVARLKGRNGLSMQVQTTAPGLQLYDGAYIENVPGHGRRHGPHAGLALEAQGWPDAPNRPDFPDVILRPGSSYRETTIYRFAR